MNQKDYKAIAKMIKKHKGKYANIIIFSSFLIDLIDYFEKTQEIGRAYNFNRKQFLKDCGVEE